jgi:hypothetical protein
VPSFGPRMRCSDQESTGGQVTGTEKETPEPDLKSSGLAKRQHRSSRLLCYVKRCLPRPGGGPVQIGTIRQQVLRGDELPTVAGVPEVTKALRVAVEGPLRPGA